MRPALTRRGCLIGFGVATAASAGANERPAPANGDVPLCAAAAPGGLSYGAAVQIDLLRAESDLLDITRRECRWLTPELALKWSAVEPRQGQFDLRAMDDLAEFAAAEGKRLRGHTLLWHDAIPSWAVDALGTSDGWGLVSRQIALLVRRYDHIVDEWDVINEPIDTGSRMDGLRPSAFLQAFGPDYIPRALHTARQCSPQARLMINEYGLEYDNPVEGDRRYLFLQLLRWLRQIGAPLDGVGIQAHLDLGKTFSKSVFAAFLQDVAALGLSITITELDIKEADYTLPVDERDRRVAREAARFLQVALDQPAVTGVVTWGLSDRHSWLKVTPEDLARHPGAWRDGSHPGLNRGLPFDAAMRPKALYREMRRELLRRRPRWRPLGPSAQLAQ